MIATRKINFVNTFNRIIFGLIILCPLPGKAQKFDEKMLLKRLQIMSHDTLEGRGFGTIGNHKAQQFLADEFARMGIAPGFDQGYRQTFEHTLKGRMRQSIFPVDNPGTEYKNVTDTVVMGGNVGALILGRMRKVIVISGHLDHLGIRKGEIYNGADDNASGSTALISIAEYFKSKNPMHTLFFAAVDGEERGFIGANYLLNNFPGSLDDVILNVNLDMIAHNDKNELYVCGAYHYPSLKKPLEGIIVPVKLLFGHDTPADKGSDNWTSSSDHVVFHKKGIPFLYFGVEDHEDYHKESDEFKTINQQFYIDAVKSIIKVIEVLDKKL